MCTRGLRGITGLLALAILLGSNETADAMLELNVPGGQSHDAWMRSEAVRVMQDTDDVDMDVVAKFTTIPSVQYQMHGFHFDKDLDNWLRFGANFGQGSLHLFVGETTGGSSQARHNQAITWTDPDMYLRVNRTSDTFDFYYSANGTTWTLAKSLVYSLTLNPVGVHAGNYATGSAPQHTAKVDFFEVSSTPIAVEDGSVAADVQAPFIHGTRLTPAVGQLTVSWFTDEPSIGSLEYGPDTGYGTLLTEAGGPSYEHAITITGLVESEPIHYRLLAEDGGALVTTTDDVEYPREVGGSLVDVWYGTSQSFGSLGMGQPWVNVLGNVADLDGITSLTYTLNGGSPVALTVGADSNRLINNGDFNIDLHVTSLLDGANTVVIAAIDGSGALTTQVVSVQYTPGTVWPLPYAIKWSSLTTVEEIQDVAQIIEGKWMLGGVRTEQPGYDRLIAIGGRTWDDYTVTVPITELEFRGDFGIGVLLRWDGHTNVPVVCAQPKCGWEPHGDIAWMRPNRLELFHGSSTPRTWNPGIEYMLKASAETLPGGDTTYSVKLWDPATEAEPDWQVTRTTSDTLATGSPLLITHLSDVTFGNVGITPVGVAPPSFRRGDPDASGDVDMSDAIRILGFLFLGTAPPLCSVAADANDDFELDLSDALVILRYIFLAEVPPEPPGPSDCGTAPSPLSCVEYNSC
jgi:regulation of enolase protein 1 (concanavalin A-like superfamily)